MVSLQGDHNVRAEVCGKLVTSNVTSNLYDISVEASVALGDLLSLNPTIKTATPIDPGTQLVRPCYATDAPTYFGALLSPCTLTLDDSASFYTERLQKNILVVTGITYMPVNKSLMHIPVQSISKAVTLSCCCTYWFLPLANYT